MAKRPKDSPFGALASLRGRVAGQGNNIGDNPTAGRRTSSGQSSATAALATAAPATTTPAIVATISATAAADQPLDFSQAVGPVAPIRSGNRAQLEKPRPAPLPIQHRAETPVPADNRPAIGRIDPNDMAALLAEAMGGVAPLKGNNRAEIDRRPVTGRRATDSSNGTTLTTLTARDDSAAPRDAPPALQLPLDENDPAALFRLAIGNTAALPESGRATLVRPMPAPRPRQREADEANEAAVLHESIAAPHALEDRTNTDDEGVHLRGGLPRRVLTDLRRGRWATQDELDLHGLTRDEACVALAAFLHHALEQGYRCVRLIHGKGLGSPGRIPVLKHLSQSWLMQREEILAFCQAKPQDGGAGALLILLQRMGK